MQFISGTTSTVVSRVSPQIHDLVDSCRVDSVCAQPKWDILPTKNLNKCGVHKLGKYPDEVFLNMIQVTTNIF